MKDIGYLPVAFLVLLICGLIVVDLMQLNRDRDSVLLGTSKDLRLMANVQEINPNTGTASKAFV